jgi:hypothetical protein
MKYFQVDNYIDLVFNTRTQMGLYTMFVFLGGSTFLSQPVFEVSLQGVSYITDAKDVTCWSFGPYGNADYSLWYEVWGPLTQDFWLLRITRNKEYAGTIPPVGLLTISELIPYASRNDSLVTW